LENISYSENRAELDALIERFKKWLHVEDPSTLYTLCAAKISHRLQGDPVWLMIIGPSSDGKSELLRAFTQPGEITLDDLSEHTFVSGYQSKATKDIPQFAQTLANRIWYIYDLSIMMSKPFEERSTIFSDLRMIYDGRLIKRFGNKTHFDIPTPNNTLICGSTPVIDRTILEDQLMGTRFMTWRTKTGDRRSIMQKIDEVDKDFSSMRSSLQSQVHLWATNVKTLNYEYTELDNNNLQILANQTTLMRTSVDTDRNRELVNEAYPEAPGRFYRQLKKMYKSYRIIGLTEEESLKCCRKLCMDCIIPLRLKILEWLYNNNHSEGQHSLSEVAVGTQMGKGATQTHLSALMGLGIVRYEDRYNQQYHRDVTSWQVQDGNWKVLFPQKSELKQSELVKDDKWESCDHHDGTCAGCGFKVIVSWKLGGDYYCDSCHKDY
jgi:hypothetical protein